MDWIPLTILLHHEDTGTFVVVGVILNHNCLGNARYYVSHKNTISSQFIIPMARYWKLSSVNEFKNPLKCLTHKLMFILSSGTHRLFCFSGHVKLSELCALTWG